MSPKRAVLLVLVTLAAVLLAGTTRRAGAEGDDTKVWRDPARLQALLDEACGAVEISAGTAFGTRPVVVVSSQQRIEDLLAHRDEGDRGLSETTPDEARRFIAYYEPTTREIHLVPDAMEAMAEALDEPRLLSEDVLKVILVHEATHALDYQRFPVRWTLACCANADERLATEAVLEGHAQLVAEEVARRWDILEAFDLLTRMYAGAPTEDQEAAFTYLQGHAFMRSVRTTSGRSGVEAVLRDPPTETRVIDRPILWMEPARRLREHDLQAVLEVFRPLMPTDWKTEKWRVLGPVPPDGGTTTDERLALHACIDNHGMYGRPPEGHEFVNGFVAHCRDAEEAATFVRSLEAIDRNRDGDGGWEPATRSEGVGPSGALAGFTSVRRASSDSDAPPLTLLVAREGHYVVELTAYGVPDRTRSDLDEAMEQVTRLLRAQPVAGAAVALRAHVRDFLKARAEGRAADARALLRDLLPTPADLRRVVRPSLAAAFSERYRGPTLALRTTAVPDATLEAAFRGAGANAQVVAYAASAEDLAAGQGQAARLPPQMRGFGASVAAPATTWMTLEITNPGGPTERYACFVRLADRFLWIADPWRVPVR